MDKSTSYPRNERGKISFINIEFSSQKEKTDSSLQYHVGLKQVKFATVIIYKLVKY